MADGGSLQGRKVLIVSPRFFGYERRIEERLQALGAQVMHVDDRGETTTLTKALIRINPALIQGQLDSYHRAACERLADWKFETILFISPEGCGISNIQRYQKAFPEARLLLYMWDAFENKSHRDVPALLALFDRTFSFDREDCQKYGMTFRPLFFSQSDEDAAAAPEYDYSFIGTIHSDRFAILKRLQNQYGQSLRSYLYPYFPSRLLYWFCKLTKPEFWGVARKAFRFAPLPYSEVMRVMQASAAIVDIEHPGQRGLTMRTLEVIGAGKKLITTNPSIVQYPFYSPERIQVLDRKAPAIAEGFFAAPLEPLSAEIMAAYSLDGWLEEILLAT